MTIVNIHLICPLAVVESAEREGRRIRNVYITVWVKGMIKEYKLNKSSISS